VVTHQVVSDATSFLVLETDRTSDDTAAGVTTRLARTITEYEPGNLGLVRKVHRWIQGEDYATTVLKQRPTTGVLLWAQKAEQYAAAPDAPDESRLKTTLTYDERDLFVRETVNEVGHVTQTTIDLGTGAATGQYGPTVWRGPECSPRTCQRFYLGTRSEVDGFGRVVKQWRHSDTELPFDFPAPQISAVFTYTDAAGQPAVIESEIYRVLGDATTAVRQRATTDGTGLVLATLRHGSGNIPETGTTYTYTEAGMVKTVTGVDPSDDARTATTTHQYDALGRPTSAMRPDSTGMLVGYSGHETTTTETALGKDPGPLAVKVAYSDAFGNLVRSVEDGSATTTYTVDSAGRTGQIQDADGHVVTFTHDGLGRRRSITRGNRTWHYGFDRNGNLTSITAPHDGGDATAYTTTIAYDAVDRPTSRVQGTRALTASDLAQLGSGSATWIYDEGLNANTTGRLTTETTAVGTNSQLTRRYAYDIAGNPTTEQLTLQLLDGRFSIDRMLGRRFDMLNQPTSVTHGDGSGERPATYTEIGFDAVGRPSELRRRATPDAPESVVLASAEWSRSDRLRGRSAARAGVHLSQIIEHDALGRVTGTDVRRGPSATGPWTSVASQTQQYFAAGDPRSMTTFLAADKTSQRQDWTFEYDGKHQLVAATGAGFYAAEYGYSEAGRLEYAAVDGPGIQRSDDYEYHWAGNGPDAPVLLTGGPGGVRELVWDSAGNLQLDVQSAERAQYRYDGADDLRRADTQGIGGSSTELHYYDASGGRVATIRMAGGQPTGMTAWFGDTTLEYDGDGNLVRTEAAIGLAGSVGRIVDGGAVDYTFHNHLGHLLAATSEVGELIAGFTYSPYGELLRVAGSEADEFRERFSGKTLDRSGLSYYGARYYDPSLMLWTQADPLYRFAPDNAGLDPRLSLLYAFTRNNPLRYVDPDGLQAVPRVTGPGGIASVPAMRPPAHVPTPPEMERMLINGVGNATVMILSEETPEGVSQEANRQQRIATARVVRELAESDPMAREILGELIFGRNQHEIILVTRVDPQANIRSRPRAGNPNQGSDTVILINVDYEATVRNSDGSLLTLTWKTAALHELIHALEAELGLLYPQAPYRDVYRHIAEWRAVGLIPPIRPGLNENEYRARQGLPARLCYSCPRVEAPQMRPPR
jgi:RHS repeat-associated protein